MQEIHSPRSGAVSAFCRLADLCVARPRAALLAGLLITALGASGLPRLALRTDGKTIYPSGDPVVELSAADARTWR